MILLENYDKYKELLEVSENSEGTAERKYQSYQESYAAAQARLNAAKEGIANDSQISKLLITLTDAATGIIEMFQKIYPWIPMLVSSIFTLKEAFGSSTMTLIATSLQSLGGKGGGKSPLLERIAEWKKEKKIKKEQQIVEKEQTETVKNNTTAQKQNTEATDENSTSQKNNTKSSGNSFRALGIAISTVTAAVAQFWTAGNTHTYNGETVESSERAQKAGGGISAVISMIPILGPLVGPLVASAVAAAFDKERDYANAASEKAAQRTSELTNMSSYLDRIKEAGFGSKESQKALSDFAQNIFSEDYEITRKLLQQYLGNKDISSYLQEIQDNTGATAEAAYEQLKIAMLEAEKAQVADKYSSQLYKNNANFNDLYAEYSDYDGNAAYNYKKDIFAFGAGGAGAGALAGAATAFAAGGPVGWIIGGLVAVGAAIGIATGHLLAAAETQDEIQRKAQEQQRLNEMDNTEKMQYFTEILNEEYKKTEEERDSTKISQLNQLISSLKDQNNILNQIREETNNLTLEQAFISAKGSIGGQEEYLSSMTTEELKTLGVDKILEIFGESIMANGGLRGENFYNLNGEISSSGYEFLMKKLRAQNDNEINAVLSGDSYTLAEALLLNGEYGRRIRKSFAIALNVTEETLKDLENLYGVLTLSEITSSSKEKIEQVEKYSSLVDSISKGAGKTSEWMNTIITQFPDLIQYMGKTPDLFDKIVKKIQSLAALEVQTQFDEIMSVDKYYSDTKEAFLASLGEEDANLVRGTEAKNYQGIVTLISSLGNTDQAKRIQAALNEILRSLDITSTLMTSTITPVLETQDKLLERQLNNLNEQKQALQEINNQREYENKLIEARNNLENAQKGKHRVYRAGIGFVYESNQEEIIKAQQELEEIQREKEISRIDVQIQEVEYQRNELANIFEKANFEEQLNSMESILNNITGGNGSLYSLVNTLSAAATGIKATTDKLVKTQVDTKTKERESAIGELKTLWGDVLSQTDHTGAYNTAIETYYTQLQKYIKEFNLTEKDLKDLKKMGNLQGGSAAGANAWKVGQLSLSDLRSEAETRYSITPFLTGYTRETLLGQQEENKLFEAMQSGNISIYAQDAKGNIVQITDKKILQAREGETSAEDILARIKSEKNYSQIILGDNGEIATVYKDQELFKLYTNSNRNEYRAKAEQFAKEIVDNGELTSGVLEETKKEIIEQIVSYILTGKDDPWALDSVLLTREDRHKINDFINSNVYTKQNQYIMSLDEYLPYKKNQELKELEEFEQWTKKISTSLLKPINMTNEAFSAFLREQYEKAKKEYEARWESRTDSNTSGSSSETKMGRETSRTDVGLAYASGSLSARGGISLLNELGTEAIVTPGGTITALPSGAGIVPADITSNLWQLGEIAPGLLRIMQNKLSPDTIGKSTLGMITDESFNINNLEMNVNADASFDVDKFMNSIKSRISLTRNLKN